MSCLAEQAKILVAEAEENNLEEVLIERWAQWDTCGLCEQQYHGVVACALGWACWKTYLGRPEADWLRQAAMNLLGVGLGGTEHHEEALTVKEAELSMLRRIGASEDSVLVAQGNLARTYASLGWNDQALRMHRDVYSGRLELHGEEHEDTLLDAVNYANCLQQLRRFEEVKALLRKRMPVARRVFGVNDDHTLKMRCLYASALYEDPAAALDDLREAVTTLEETERTARRILGGAHPLSRVIEDTLRDAGAALRARETPST